MSNLTKILIALNVLVAAARLYSYTAALPANGGFYAVGFTAGLVVQHALIPFVCFVIYRKIATRQLAA